MNTNVLKSATCPNGRFGDLLISVEERIDGEKVEYVWRNGHSDPLVCEYADAIFFFNERLKDAALYLLRELSSSRDDLSFNIHKGNSDRFLLSIK